MFHCLSKPIRDWIIKIFGWISYCAPVRTPDIAAFKRFVLRPAFCSQFFSHEITVKYVSLLYPGCLILSQLHYFPRIPFRIARTYTRARPRTCMYVYVDQFSGFTFCHESWLSCRGIDWIFIFFAACGTERINNYPNSRSCSIECFVRTVKRTRYRNEAEQVGREKQKKRNEI